jgi:chemotaxis protein MotA
MDISSIIGFVIATGVVLWLAMSGGDISVLVDLHAGVCVLGGALAATMVRFPLASTP